jgi:hypothetical protein
MADVHTDQYLEYVRPSLTLETPRSCHEVYVRVFYDYYNGHYSPIHH